VKGAKSSLTVPLKLHNEVIGTFNVESPQPHAFSDSDLRFLEVFCRDVAGSLNTLQLLVAQRAGAAMEFLEAIHRAVAQPIDEILNAAVILAESGDGLATEQRSHLQSIIRRARDIRKVIVEVGHQLAPVDAIPTPQTANDHTKLQGRRVLVVDADQAVRTSAHTLLEQYGCVVEAVQLGTDAALMYQNSLRDNKYDVVMTGIKLPDMTGFDLMMKLKHMINPVPLILMSEFGWDAGHTLVKARQNGLHSRGILIKPFILKQLLDTVELIIDSTGEAGKA